MLKCTPADLEAMSLYRTNSDRGLWKKYRSEQPKHFHKPCYIGKEQEKTQVLRSFIRPRSREPSFYNCSWLSSCISVKKGPYLDVVLNQLIFDMNKHCRSPTHNYNWARTTDFTGCSIAEIPISLIIRTLLRALRPRRALLRLRVSTKSTAE